MTANSLLCGSVMVVVALVVVKAVPVKNVEHHKYLMLLVETEGKVAIGRVVEEVVVTREKWQVVLVVEEVVVMVMVGVEVVVEVVVEEVAEKGSQEEVMVELAGVVEVVGMVVEIAVVMMAMIMIICLNIRIGRGSDWKTMQNNSFKQTVLQGSPLGKWTMNVSTVMLCCSLVRVRHSAA